MITEAPTKLDYATLRRGLSHCDDRFSARITPAAFNLEAGITPTMCTIEVPTLCARQFTTALHGTGCSITTLTATTQLTTVTANFGYETLVNVVEKLAMLKLDWRGTVQDPNYWFSFGEGDGPLKMGMRVTSIQRSNRVIEIRQNRDSPDDEPAPAVLSEKFWSSFQDALRATTLSDNGKVLVSHPRRGGAQPRFISMTLSPAATADFELSLHEIMRLVPRT